MQALQQEDIRKLLAQKKLISPELVSAIKKQGFVEIDNSGPVLTIKRKEVSQEQAVVSVVQPKQELVEDTSVSAPKPSDVYTVAEQENTAVEQENVAVEQEATPSSPITQENKDVRVMFSYHKESKKWTVQDFVQHYHARYELIASFLTGRIQGLTSIGSLRARQTEGKVAIIGMVLDKYLSKNGHLMFELEDPTGSIRVIISKTNALFKEAEDIVVDEVIGIEGFAKKDAVFANQITVPDIPNITTKKVAPTPGAAVFLSDIHVGSKQFLHREFNKFLTWINGKEGTEKEKALAKNVKYVLISGDIVDGVGIYPQQDKELAIQDIYDQYEALTQLLEQIPSHIQLVIAPGNHDAMRLSEPQPSLESSSFATSLKRLSNAVFVSNPGIVNIHASEGFSGFNVLLYHGYSFDYYVAKVPSIRFNGGYDNPCEIMKFLLTRRHLAPAHGSTLYLPDGQDDALVIKQVPDIFLAGHVHRTAHAYYRNVLLLNASCWQGTTDFQERMGHIPSPAKTQVVDLQTREITTLDFSMDIEEKEEQKNEQKSCK